MNNEQTQDLRERAQHILSKFAATIEEDGFEYYLGAKTIDAMLQFAAEQTEPLKQRIAELEKQIEDLHHVIKELRGDITAQELIDGF